MTRHARPVLLATLACLALSACTDAGPRQQSGERPDRIKQAEDTRRGETWAILINGGGNARQNYQSHLLHVRELLGLLRERGVPDERLFVFSSDGHDPAPDLAVRDRQPEADFWLIEGLPIGNSLRTEIRLENTELDDVWTAPASKAALNQWVHEHGPRLEAGDTLLIYVTDHGKKNEANLDNNTIVLWGESLSVKEFGMMLDRLPAGIRIVSLMSQCFSGSFANLMYDLRGEPSGDVCGYYSSAADRPAYGCYPENRGKDNVGHSFRFFEGINLYGNLSEAHDRVLLSDRTPDVPNRTSDGYIKDLLRREAAVRRVTFDSLVDSLLSQAWQDELHYDDEFSRIDHLGHAFGSFGPRSLEELDERARRIPALANELASYAKRWKGALLDLKRENFARFLQTFPFWRDYIQQAFVADLDNDGKRRLSAWLLEDLVEFTEKDQATSDRLHALKTIAAESQTASYRMEVRRAVVLRMRALLTRIAGLVYLDRVAGADQRQAFEALVACEDLTIGRATRPSRRARALPPPFPPLIDEMELLANVLPGWLGIEYAHLQSHERRALDLEPGAVRITRVVPGSPAEKGGLRQGDIVLGPPGSHFVERNRIREWVLTSIVDEVRLLDVLRDSNLLTVRVRIGAAPV